MLYVVCKVVFGPFMTHKFLNDIIPTWHTKSQVACKNLLDIQHSEARGFMWCFTKYATSHASSQGVSWTRLVWPSGLFPNGWWLWSSWLSWTGPKPHWESFLQVSWTPSSIAAAHCCAADHVLQHKVSIICFELMQCHAMPRTKCSWLCIKARHYCQISVECLHATPTVNMLRVVRQWDCQGYNGCVAGLSVIQH